MRTIVIFLCMILGFSSSLKAASDTFNDYQNYNHGYCPDCNCYPCRCGQGPPGLENNMPSTVPPTPGPQCVKPDPCRPAPVCACQCGMSLWVIGGAIVVVATVGALLISNNNGHAHG